MTWENFWTLLAGAQATLTISVLGMLLAVALGVLAAIGAQSIAPARWMVALYVSFFRGTPLLIQVLIIFFILPSIGLQVSTFGAGIIALGLNGGAHICEMIRGALTAIAPGQVEAARALAMSRFWIWLRIVLPQAFVLILPPLMVEFAALIKGSSLISVIGYLELARSAEQILATSTRPFVIYVGVALMYFVMCFSIALTTQYIQRVTVTRYSV